MFFPAAALNARRAFRGPPPALDVVYGDIGTSPLYAFKEAFKPQYPEVGWDFIPTPRATATGSSIQRKAFMPPPFDHDEVDVGTDARRVARTQPRTVTAHN